MRLRNITGWVVKFSYMRFKFDKYFDACDFAKKLMEHNASEDDCEATLIPIYAEGEEFEQKVAMTFKEMLDEDPDELVEVNA